MCRHGLITGQECNVFLLITELKDHFSTSADVMCALLGSFIAEAS